MKLDKTRIRTKFEDIQGAIKRLSEFMKIKRDAFLSNEDFIHIARSHLLIAAEASISVCYHIAARYLKKIPSEYGLCFELLQKHNFISADLANYFVKLVGLRNKMVHRYEEIDYGSV